MVVNLAIVITVFEDRELAEKAVAAVEKAVHHAATEQADARDRRDARDPRDPRDPGDARQSLEKRGTLEFNGTAETKEHAV